MTGPLHWYVLRTIPVHRVEFRVLHALTQREHPAIVPFEEKWVKKPGTRQPDRRKFPLFPCYVFVGLHDHRAFLEAKSAINDHAERMGKAPPILNLVGFGTVPAVLSDADVAFLRRLAVERPTSVNLHKAIQPGSEVNILDGPFRGFTARVDSVSRKKVRVSLSLFNSMQVVDVSASALEAA